MSWFDWSLLDKHADVRRFVSLLAARRQLRDVKHERIALADFLTQASKAWHGVKLNEPDWGDNSYSVALSGEIRDEGLTFYLILNAYWEPREFELPNPMRSKWRRWIDTALASPSDIAPWDEAPELSADTYRAQNRSVVMLYASGKTN